MLLYRQTGPLITEPRGDFTPEKILALTDWARGRERAFRPSPAVRIAKAARMADGLFYNDLREPFLSADIGAVTLATTDKALYPASNFPVLGGQYFGRPGKKLRIRMFGKITTAATPGNGSWDVYYGTGADANGVLLQSSAAHALIASQTNLSWWAEFYVHCRTTGNAGTLFCDGIAFYNQAVVANTNQPVLVPASAAVVSGACDLTAALIVSVQYKRSGSTVETMAVQDLEVTACN